VTGFVEGIYAEPMQAPDPRPLAAGVQLVPLNETEPRATLAGGSPTIVRDAPELVAVRTSSTTAGTLVLADAFYPGWTATVDGRPAPIAPHEGLFRAVEIPAGEHTVIFRYQPRSLLIGAALSLLGLASAAVIVSTDLRRPRQLA
jgi:uncharacterized membrane protein YfhO